MNWTTHQKTHTSGKYSIISCIQGFELWYRDDKTYALIKRGFATLNEAKAAAEQHKALQRDPV